MTKPKYSLIAAITIDGKIAASQNQLSDWTSKEDKDFLRETLNQSDVIIVGNTTYKLYESPLAKRNCIVFSRSTHESNPANKNLIYFNPEKQDIKEYISAQGYKSVAILGGTQIYSYFLENDLITDLFITVEPIIFGQGLDLFKTQNYLEKRFTLNDVKKINNHGSLLMHYQVKD